MWTWVTEVTDWSYLNNYGLAIIAYLSRIGGLAALTAFGSLMGTFTTVWTMQKTTAEASLYTPHGRLLWVQRIFLGGVAVSLSLNTVTPFITPDPPWLSTLPLMVVLPIVILIFGLKYRPIKGKELGLDSEER